jgi:transcription elongation GreA/GreB family factor
MTVTLRRDDGRDQSFRILGEDEADQSRGTLSHLSALARLRAAWQTGGDKKDF